MTPRIVFLNSVFPSLSETFVYDQFEILRDAGLDFVIASNNKPLPAQIHPRMRPICGQVIYLCDVNLIDVAASHLHCMLRWPLGFLRALLRLPFMEERLITSLAHLSGAAVLLKRFPDWTLPLFHAHFTYGAAAVALWCKRIAGADYTLTLHGSDVDFDNPPDLACKLREATSIVSISAYNRDFLCQRQPELSADKFQVIPLGIPERASARSSPDSRPARRRLVSVGRLSEQKAQHLLIDACAELASEGLDFECWIVGEGPQRPLLEQRIRDHGLEARVKLLGSRYHDEVLNLYEESDLFVMSSVAEGMPVAIMEAMRAGLPVIAPALSGIPELVDDAGMLFPPGDVAAIADRLRRCLAGQSDLPGMTTRAREIIRHRFDLRTNTLRFKAFLERIRQP